MPRTARLILPNTPHHIVQRGHNRNAVFVEPRDYQYYWDNLAEWKTTLGLKLYAFCLMTNHIHLIVEPGEYPTDVGELMKRLAGRQTRLVNKLERRTGSLWESRYKISPIQTDTYLLHCCRYVDLNPVTAKMVAKAEDYPWSSARASIGMQTLDWLDKSPSYMALADTESQQQARYHDFLRAQSDAQRVHSFIQAAAERNQLTGSPKFVEEIAQRTGRRIEHRGPGRPAKAHE
ncbi:transposase [Simiduia curdlanivorans]|uniref:Transposase n=1 Tax=Simiduia curdlanivorans TaxID=1492769 RepID=A0ABV8V3P7_9GAMM|nr:transposase [Simiduia curdlanivorans]MDN3639934.1 transposase [Simiduia curdlanivorans]